MNGKNGIWRVIVCAVVCLLILGGVTIKETEDTVVVQKEWTEKKEVQEERAAVVAENNEIAMERAEILVEESEIHTAKQTETTDAVCLPTGAVVRGFGWQEEDGVWRYHSGIDFAYAKGEDVCTVSDGAVYRVEEVAGGYAVEVKSGDDVWRYEALSDVKVAIDERTEAGAVLGTMGEYGALHIGRQHDGEWTEPISMQNQIWE